jgi:selenocysteine lyase/cysteine desulfurase
MTDLKQTTYREMFVGLDVGVPVYGGSQQPYVNLDNAASTPALKAVHQAINDYLPYYSSVHRGTGFKSQLSTHYYEASRQIVLDFVGAAAQEYTCVFGKNSTEALNKLARRFPFTEERSIVITSGMEHHSNDLPWRANARTLHVGLLENGELNEAAFDDLLEQFGSQVALVAITGASNVTGFINPIYRLAEKAHAVGAHILVDCAQLAPHRRVHVGRLVDENHLDYIVISAHKMYAPFGTGALISRCDTLERGDPDIVGGGTVEIVTLDDVVWAGPPDRDEAGSPNIVGAIALAAAIRALERVGMEAVAAHEAELTKHALHKLPEVPGLYIYGDRDPDHAAQRLGVIPFLLPNHSHFLVAAVLGHEFGIGVRSGCFCAHPYILQLLGLNQQQAHQVREEMLAGNKADMPGLVRASFGLYNTIDDVEALVAALQKIARDEYSGRYIQDRQSGEYHLQDWQPGFEQFFSLNNA